MSGLRIAILLGVASTLSASGPYSPVRVTPRVSAEPPDELYSAGKAIYLGALKVGSGSSCSSCHSGTAALTRLRLVTVKGELTVRIENCVRSTDRVNGALQSNQLDALSHYLTKRFRL
jgi:mono/diheme cytochrome c family protein